MKFRLFIPLLHLRLLWHLDRKLLSSVLGSALGLESPKLFFALLQDDRQPCVQVFGFFSLSLETLYVIIPFLSLLVGSSISNLEQALDLVFRQWCVVAVFICVVLGRRFFAGVRCCILVLLRLPCQLLLETVVDTLADCAVTNSSHSAEKAFDQPASGAPNLVSLYPFCRWLARFLVH